MPQRKRYLFVCTNHRDPGTPKGSCATREAVGLHAALKAAIAERGLSKLEVRACTSSCLDVCWAGPAIAVSPDGYFYGRVQLGDVPAIVDALAEGRRLERLVLPPADFDATTAGPSLPERGPAQAGPAESGPAER